MNKCNRIIRENNTITTSTFRNSYCSTAIYVWIFIAHTYISAQLQNIGAKYNNKILGSKMFGSINN